MFIQHLFFAPLFMIPITFMWIAVFVLAVRLIVGIVTKKTELKKLKKVNEVILFLGSLAFLWGLLEQVTGFYQAMHAIQQAGDISPAIIADGFRMSLIAPIYGFILLILSGVFWFTFRYRVNLLMAKDQSN